MGDAPSVVAPALRGQGTPVVAGGVAITTMCTGKPNGGEERQGQGMGQERNPSDAGTHCKKSGGDDEPAESSGEGNPETHDPKAGWRLSRRP
jgi:hypothetical protein